MKRNITLLISAFLLGALFIGCGESQPIDPNKDNNNQNQEEQQKEEEQRKKEEYIKKYNDLEKKLNEELEEGYAGNTLEMRNAAETELKAWDELLNEVYGELKKDLSTDEMDKLKNKQIQWIKDRDALAIDAGSEWEGGTFQSVAETLSLKDSTKSRTLILIKDYMK